MTGHVVVGILLIVASMYRYWFDKAIGQPHR